MEPCEGFALKHYCTLLKFTSRRTADNVLYTHL